MKDDSQDTNVIQLQKKYAGPLILPRIRPISLGIFLVAVVLGALTTVGLVIMWSGDFPAMIAVTLTFVPANLYLWLEIIVQAGGRLSRRLEIFAEWMYRAVWYGLVAFAISLADYVLQLLK